MNKERITAAFDEIKADDALKQKTLQAVMTEAQPKKRMPMKLILTTAMIMVAVIAGIFSYTIPVYAISLDEASSVELQVNMYDKVVAVNTYNTGSDTDISVTNLSYTDAVQQILSSGQWDQNNLSITVAGGSKQGCERMIANLQNCSMQCMAQASYTTADNDLLQAARTAGMSMGKYKAYLILQELDSSITLEEAQNMTMQEIHQRIGMCQGMNGKGMSQKK